MAAMRAETQLLPTEPQTHHQTKGCLQRFGCEDNTLTSSQLQNFYSLKTQANILFEQQERWDLIDSLYSQYFQRQPQRSGKQWMQLGFQGQYPQTDFRGGGVLSLQLILRFVKKNRALVQVMEKDKDNFFFAITAINICFFMKKYFHLADFLVKGKDSQIYCGRRALKNFCRILENNQQSYFQIHQILLKHFYNNIWVPQSQKSNPTLLQFNSLFDRLTTKLKSTFDNHTLLTLGDFKERFTSN